MFARFYERARGYITGGLLIALGVTTLGWIITDARLDVCKSGREVDKKAYVAASEEAHRLHLEAIREKEKEYEAKAKKADAAYGELSSKYADAVRVYAKTSQSKARATASASDRGSSSSSYRPGENPFVSNRDIAHPDLDITEVVVVPVNDLMVCAENTARLVVARDWALGLNE